jgi:hypothetical protein
MAGETVTQRIARARIVGPVLFCLGEACGRLTQRGDEAIGCQPVGTVQQCGGLGGRVGVAGVRGARDPFPHPVVAERALRPRGAQHRGAGAGQAAVSLPQRVQIVCIVEFAAGGELRLQRVALQVALGAAGVQRAESRPVGATGELAKVGGTQVRRRQRIRPASEETIDLDPVQRAHAFAQRGEFEVRIQRIGRLDAAGEFLPFPCRRACGRGQRGPERRALVGLVGGRQGESEAGEAGQCGQAERARGRFHRWIRDDGTSGSSVAPRKSRNGGAFPP